MVEYRKLTTLTEIYEALKEFDVCFPHLKEKVEDYRVYAQKLSECAEIYLQAKASVTAGLSVFYANDEKQFCGYVALIGVKEEFQGHGLGRGLLQFSENVMRERNMRMVRLEVDDDNKNAQMFYEHMGYVREAQASDTSHYLCKALSE